MKKLSKEEKELLLKDLCSRLPYGVKCHFKYGSVEGDVTLSRIEGDAARFEYGWYYGGLYVSIDANYIKPYLRPMSSMTEEEHKEYEQWLPDGYCIDTIDWLNKNHFDYRGLIPMDLALEAPKDMYS